MTKVAILQSNYIPWKGYFDLIGAVDTFVYYDDVQYTKGDWRNRNRIKTPQGVQWLTVPVGASIDRPIREVEIRDPGCGAAHWQRLAANYARARCFDETAAWLEPLYVREPWRSLSDTNRLLIEAVCQRLGIGTRFCDVSRFAAGGDRSERLVGICRELGADTYVSGPSARDYLDTAAFARAGVAVEWFSYAGYPEYRQLWGPFVHEVTVLDLLFNCGADARQSLLLAATAPR